MHHLGTRTDLLDRFGVHAAEDDTGVGRGGAQAERDFFAAVQADTRHADGAFQSALLNHWCLERKNHAAILSQHLNRTKVRGLRTEKSSPVGFTQSLVLSPEFSPPACAGRTGCP